MAEDVFNAQATPEAEEPAGFARLRRVLMGAAGCETDVERERHARTVRMAVHTHAFERATLNNTVPATVRLSQLASLHDLIINADLPPRPRDDVLIEIGRAAQRVLWNERLVETVLEADARAVTRAAALLSLVARGVIPAGAAAKALLEPAKELLLSADAGLSLAESPKLRTQMIELLEAAEAGGAHRLDGAAA
jgi:hypothetical protein